MVSHGKLPPKNRNSALTYAKKLLGLANQDEVKLRHNIELLVSASPDGRHLGYYLGIANREASGWRRPGEADAAATAAKRRKERAAMQELKRSTNAPHIQASLENLKQGVVIAGSTPTKARQKTEQSPDKSKASAPSARTSSGGFDWLALSERGGAK